MNYRDELSKINHQVMTELSERLKAGEKYERGSRYYDLMNLHNAVWAAIQLSEKLEGC